MDIQAAGFNHMTILLACGLTLKTLSSLIWFVHRYESKNRLGGWCNFPLILNNFCPFAEAQGKGYAREPLLFPGAIAVYDTGILWIMTWKRIILSFNQCNHLHLNRYRKTGRGLWNVKAVEPVIQLQQGRNRCANIVGTD